MSQHPVYVTKKKKTTAVTEKKTYKSNDENRSFLEENVLPVLVRAF